MCIYARLSALQSGIYYLTCKQVYLLYGEYGRMEDLIAAGNGELSLSWYLEERRRMLVS